MQIFEKAMALFHKREFAQAAPLFGQAAEGPTATLAHAARMHQRMCERRVSQAAPAPRSPEELYTLGVALINQGRYAEAESQLRSAIEAGGGQADHFHYALGLAAGLRGDLEESARQLERAIALNPANRVTARNDSDWHLLARQSPVREILHGAPEKTGTE